jgi:hypothetical protein
MIQPFQSARDVSEHLLNITGQALLENNVDDFLPCFGLPMDLQTLEEHRIIRTADDLRKIFFAVCKHYATIGLTDMARRCVEAEFKDPETVVSMHETRLITGNIITRSPFAVLSTLKFDGRDWRIVSCSYAIEDHPDHNAALMSAGELYSHP